ncbi:MAG: hypothetical protein J1E06_10200 [Acutalibacter sp.]|nr:hypothetical protein [Acutalibacter sp.]
MSDIERQNNMPGMRRLRNRTDYQELDGNYYLDNFVRPEQPTFDTEEMRGSMQYILAKNIGQYVVVEFLIGTDGIMRKQGMLYYVGRSFITLYDESANNFIICDVFSIKFVYFYFPGDRPRFNYNLLPGPNGEPGTGNRRR